MNTLPAVSTVSDRRIPCVDEAGAAIA